MDDNYAGVQPVNVTPIPLPVHLDDQDRQAYELLVRSAAAVFAAGFALRQVAQLLRRKA